MRKPLHVGMTLSVHIPVRGVVSCCLHAIRKYAPKGLGLRYKRSVIYVNQDKKVSQMNGLM